MRIFVLLFLPLFCEGLYKNEDSKVVTLGEKAFETSVMESDDSVWLIEFYAPWCGHCKQFAPQYEKIAGNLQGLVKVGAVDCDEHKSLASRFGIKGFPTLKIFPSDKTYNPYQKKWSKIPLEYTGPRSAKGMVENVLAQLPNFVHMVAASNVSIFLDDDYPKVLLVSDKDAVAPLMKSLAVQFRNRIRFGQASSKDKDLISKLGISEFPKLLAFAGKDNSPIEHSGKLKKDELQTFISKYARTEKLEDPFLEITKPKLMKRMTDQELKEAWEQHDKDIWLVFFHNGGKVPADMERLATSFKSFKLASVDCSSTSDNCKSLNIDNAPVLRMYQADKSEYEDYRGPPTCLDDCFEVGAMADFAGENIPNIVAAVTETTWNNFLAPAAERPRPLLFTKKPEPSALYKSVALHFKGVLTFGLFANPPKRLMDQLQIKKLPQLHVFFSQNGTAETVQGFPYQGGFSFEELTALLNQFAAPFMEKPSTPQAATSSAPTGPIPSLAPTKDNDYGALCGNKGGLCALFFLDGSDANKDKQEEQLKTIAALRTKKHPSPYHFLWVDAVCHASFSAVFDVGVDKLPTMAVISPSKQLFTLHVGKFVEAELDRTLEEVLRGRKKTGPFGSLSALETKSCADIHAEIAAATQVTDSEDDDILKEMMAEIEQKRKVAEDADEDGGDSGEGKKSKKKKRKSKKKK